MDNKAKFDNERSTQIGLLGMASALIAFVIGLWFESWVFAQLWNWFVAPMFGFMMLSLGTAVGLNLALAMLRMPSISKDLSGDESMRSAADVIACRVARMIAAAFLFGVGSIAYNYF